jgi:hypothetical protein
MAIYKIIQDHEHFNHNEFGKYLRENRFFKKCPFEDGEITYYVKCREDDLTAIRLIYPGIHILGEHIPWWKKIFARVA